MQFYQRLGNVMSNLTIQGANKAVHLEILHVNHPKHCSISNILVYKVSTNDIMDFIENKAIVKSGQCHQSGWSGFHLTTFTEL